MLPDSFIKQPFAVANNDNAGKAIVDDTINDRLLSLEKKILSGSHYAGQSRNRLLEETDQHIKARLLSAVRIETLYNVITELVADGAISLEQLNELLNDKTDVIISKQQDIWINQLTQEKNWPLYYSFEG
ncbi:hypothetical protein [Citrobacter sp. JGM124]|uniref:hypothetical protein n=1 Tax=Citrobacter sp. JGM124 TaxID=2799789 RepID=UPI001BA8A4AA|nr:hypothetical protein [Citrobacter sp. JGM124]MBS0849250.1 hypothetical protein [Citrobacter sp. JGM124]